MTSKRRPPARGPVALVRLQDDACHSLARALELCRGLEGLEPGYTVLIKPNYVGLPRRPYVPPYGVVTTTLVLEALIRLLRDHGCRRILVGDGGLVMPEVETGTGITMEILGVPALARRYGIQPVDLNQGPFLELESEGLALKVSRLALEADFLISLPVLKTHSQCRVSLALKNLKGCLHLRSKQVCHDAGLHLDANVARLARALYPDLAVIDGRYALAQGPFATGRARRADLILAARDALDADLVGAELLGHPPQEVAHLAETARLLGREPGLPPVVGDTTLAEARMELPHDFAWADPYTPEVYAKAGVRGFLLPKYDASLCTGCSYLYNPALVMVLVAGQQAGDLGGVELLTGKRTAPSGRARVSVLMGNCIIKQFRKHPRLGEKTVLIPGCPPKLSQVEKGLVEAGVPVKLEYYHGFLERLGRRYRPEDGFLPADFQPRETT